MAGAVCSRRAVRVPHCASVHGRTVCVGRVRRVPERLLVRGGDACGRRNGRRRSDGVDRLSRAQAVSCRRRVRRVFSGADCGGILPFNGYAAERADLPRPRAPRAKDGRNAPARHVRRSQRARLSRSGAGAVARRAVRSATRTLRPSQRSGREPRNFVFLRSRKQLSEQSDFQQRFAVQQFSAQKQRHAYGSDRLRNGERDFRNGIRRGGVFRACKLCGALFHAGGDRAPRDAAQSGSRGKDFPRAGRKL